MLSSNNALERPASSELEFPSLFGTMSSYVAVLGKPTGETSCIFGLTPQEIRYLQVSTEEREDL